MKDNTKIGKYERAHVESLLEKYGYEEDDRRRYLKRIDRYHRKEKFDVEYPFPSALYSLAKGGTLGTIAGFAIRKAGEVFEHVPIDAIQYCADHMQNKGYAFGIGATTALLFVNAVRRKLKINEFETFVDTMQANEDYVSGESFDAVPDWNTELGIDRTRTIPR